MGLSSSKAHPKVTKVAPMLAKEDLPALTAPYRLPGTPGAPSPRPPATAEWGNPTFHRQLPPLRETWYGRTSSVASCSLSHSLSQRRLKSIRTQTLPRGEGGGLHPSKSGCTALYNELDGDEWLSTATSGPLSFNTVLEKGETSIIKQHPPRRPQRLEPAGPPQAIAPAKPRSQQEVSASPKPKALEKRGQSLRHLPGRRQHLHKLQMLDLTRRRREAELKRDLHREAKINKQKIKEFSPKKVLDTLQRGDSAESRDLVPAEHNQRFHGDDCGNVWGRGLSRQHDGSELSPSKSKKVDLWFRRESRTRDLFWDTSSTGSEEWEGEEKKICHKPTLVRTKTERVSLFDDFFDKDF